MFVYDGGHTVDPNFRNNPMPKRLIIPHDSEPHLPAIADDAMQQTPDPPQARPQMRRETMRTKLLAAVAALGLGAAPAFAADLSSNSGYLYPNFWGNEAAQQPAPAAKTSAQSSGATIGVYATQSSHGTWLFPPNPNSGANG
jgi:hypothetical protein